MRLFGHAVVRLCLAAAVALLYGVLGSGLSELVAGEREAPPPKRPNIVVFVSDDHGWHFSGCYGNRDVRTPNIDQLARDGMRFTRMFAASPTCTPSRSSLWTGLYPQHHGAMGNHTNCRPEVKSLPMYLAPLGYRVVMANKADVRPRSRFPFEYLHATLPRSAEQPRKYRAEGLDTAAVDRFLAEHVRTRPREPLCLILGDNCPHVTWERNKIYDPQALAIPPYMVDTPITRRALANYYQDITTMDRHLGEVLQSLERHGLSRNTVVIYTSDQGAEWPHCKWTLYDTGLLVPFIVRWPTRVRPGSVCGALVSAVDLTPTLVDLAGGQPPEGIDGRSFRSLLTGDTMTFRDEVFATHTGDGRMNRCPQRGMRNARYKYILNLHPERRWTTHFTLVPGIPESHKQVWDSWVQRAATDKAAARLIDLIENHPREELYDTENDPYELNNLADDPHYEPILEQMRSRLEQWRREVGDVGDP